MVAVGLHFLQGNQYMGQYPPRVGVTSLAQNQSRATQPSSNTDQIQLSSQSNLTANIPAIGAFKMFEEGFVKNNGGQFSIDGKPFRYVGTNMYSLTWETPETREKMIADAAKEGFTVIRFWSYPPRATHDEMEHILDMGKKYGVKFIPTLWNQAILSDSDKHHDHWYKQGYREKYLPFVQEAVTRFKDRPEVMMWELINEPETESFSAMFDFSQDVSEEIKSLDPNHMVSIGTIGGVGDKFGSQLSRFDNNKFKRLYSLPTLDAMSIHDYSYDATILERLDLNSRNHGDKKQAKFWGQIDQVVGYLPRKLDSWLLGSFNTRRHNPISLRGIWNTGNQANLQAAKELGKPLYIGEVGFKKHHGTQRKQLFELDMNRWFNNGAQGYMLWSFQAQNKSIDGHDYGFDGSEGLSPLIKGWNNRFMDELNNP